MRRYVEDMHQQAHFAMRSPTLLLAQQHIGSAGTGVRMIFQLRHPVEIAGGLLYNGAMIECTDTEAKTYCRELAKYLGLNIQ